MRVSKRKKRIKKKTKKKKNKKVSAFAKKKEVDSALVAREQLLVLMYNDVYFTKDLNYSLPCEVVSLLQEFIFSYFSETSFFRPPMNLTIVAASPPMNFIFSYFSETSFFRFVQQVLHLHIMLNSITSTISFFRPPMNLTIVISQSPSISTLIMAISIPCSSPLHSWNLELEFATFCANPYDSV